MEIIFYIVALIVVIAFLFLIVEYPYYFVGPFVFILFYNFNIELPGLLDLRGVFSLFLLLRLIIFDKENLNLVLDYLIKNSLFLFIVIFEIYLVAVTYINTGKFISSLRVPVFQVIGMVIGFLTVYRGYVKSTFLLGIIFAGIFATVDLVYSYTITGGTFNNTRILDVLTKAKYKINFNHNFFGMISGIATVITSISFIQTKKRRYIFLLVLLSTGVLISTSRGSLMAVIISLMLVTFFLPEERINFKTIFVSVIKGIALLFVVITSYYFFTKVVNLESKFAERIHYRLIEEPLEMLQGGKKKFKGDRAFTGTIEWREKQASRDVDKFFSLSHEAQFFGLGKGGYSEIGAIDWGVTKIRNKLFRYTSHNGYVLLLIERGIVGFLLFVVMYSWLTIVSVQSFKYDFYVFPFLGILLFFLLFTYGAQNQLLDRFAFVVFGGIIGQKMRLHHEENIELE